jgi:16S rRNA (cytosine967-C5)-methyltransferase
MKQASSTTKISARLVAAKALNKFDASQKQSAPANETALAYAADILSGLLSQTEQKPRATDLVLGTVKNRRAIDLVLGSIADTPAKRISPVLVNIVRLGIYELVYRPEIPEYSIINDAAENTKSVAAAKQVGFVNAVLRKVASRIKNRKVLISRENVRSILPGKNSIGCKFDRRILPDPETQPAAYYNIAYSIPRWLISEWLDQYGIERTKQICIASNRRSSIYLRPNIIKTTAYGLAEVLSAARIQFKITPDEQMIKLKRPGNITALPGFDTGLFTVQDFAAVQVVPALEPQPGWRILDICAAPGTKTTQLAELTNDEAEIFATDIDPTRLEKVRQNAQRLGLSSITVINYQDLDNFAKQQGPFDAVLTDVPCSNTAVLAKRPEVRLRIKPKAVEKLMQTQAELLKTAVDLVRAGGKICYSTCSILRAENQQQIQNYLAESANLQLVSEQLLLPADEEFDHDGGYYAILQKVQS